LAALLQYVDFADVREFFAALWDDPLSTLKPLLRYDLVADVHTTVYLPFNLRNYLKDLRQRLYGKVLGKNVILFFKREEPVELDFLSDEEDYEIRLGSDKSLEKKLRLRKYSVIERFLITDLVFRLYYDTRDELADVRREIASVSKKAKYCSYRASPKIAAAKREIKLHAGGDTVVNIHCPDIIRGFVSSAFPQMSFSTVVELALLNSIYRDRHAEFGIELDERFYEESKERFERFLHQYKMIAEQYVDAVEAALVERDPVEIFITGVLEREGKITILQLVEHAKSKGYDLEEVLWKLQWLARVGRVKIENEFVVPSVTGIRVEA
jgi:hypothetical protein